MNDIYRSPTTNDESILLILKELLNHNVDVCKLIIQKKKYLEKKETMKYHYEDGKYCGWHYRLHDTQQGKYSLI